MTSRSAIGQYRDVLRLPAVTRVLISSGAARFPRGFISLALLLQIRAHTGSYPLAGACVGAFALANAASSPAQGALIDRFGQPRVLVPSAVLHGAALLAIVFGGPAASSPAALAALAALAGVAVAPVSACTRSLWRSLIPDRRLGEVVLALDATSQELIWTLGPLLCGIIVAVSSPAAALCVVAALSIIATAVYASAPAARQWRAPACAESAGRALSAPALRGFLVSIALTGACYGAMTVALPAIAGPQGARSLLAGVLLGVFSLGSMLGGVCYGARAWALPLAKRYRRLLLGIVAVTAPLILSGRSVPVAIVLSLVSGVAWAPTLTCQYGLTGTLAFPGAMTESFTWMTAAFAGGTAGGAALAGSLTRFGTGAPFAYASGLAVLAVALAFIQRGAFDAAVATQY